MEKKITSNLNIRPADYTLQKMTNNKQEKKIFSKCCTFLLQPGSVNKIYNTYSIARDLQPKQLLLRFIKLPDTDIDKVLIKQL